MSQRAYAVEFRGQPMRSVSEAKLAFFLTELNLRYIYEPQGYGAGPVNYLPDFWLPDQDVLFEVKGAEPPAEAWLKAGLVALGLERVGRLCPILFVVGNTWLAEGMEVVLAGSTVFPGTPRRVAVTRRGVDFRLRVPGKGYMTVLRRKSYWSICRRCLSPGLTVEGSRTRVCFGCKSTGPGLRIHPLLHDAFLHAQAAQFLPARPPERRGHGAE